MEKITWDEMKKAYPDKWLLYRCGKKVIPFQVKSFNAPTN